MNALDKAITKLTYDELIQQSVAHDCETFADLDVTARISLVAAYFRKHPLDFVEALGDTAELLGVFEKLDNCQLGLVVCGRLCTYTQPEIEKALMTEVLERDQERAEAREDARFENYAEN